MQLQSSSSASAKFGQHPLPTLVKYNSVQRRRHSKEGVKELLIGELEEIKHAKISRVQGADGCVRDSRSFAILTEALCPPV